MPTRPWKAHFLIMLLLTKELSIPTMAHRHHRRFNSEGDGKEGKRAGESVPEETPSEEIDCSEDSENTPSQSFKVDEPLSFVRTFGHVRFGQSSVRDFGTQINLRADTKDLYLEFSAPHERWIIERRARIAVGYLPSGGIIRGKIMALTLKSGTKEVIISAPTTQQSWWRVNRTADSTLEITEFSANQTPTSHTYTGKARDEQWLLHLLRVFEQSRDLKFAPACLFDGTCVQQCAAPICDGDECACFPPFFCRLSVSKDGERQCTEVKAVDHLGVTYDDVVFAGVDDGLKRAVKSGIRKDIEQHISSLMREHSPSSAISHLPRLASMQKRENGTVTRDETNLIWAWFSAMKHVSNTISTANDKYFWQSKKLYVDALSLVNFMLQLLADVETWRATLPVFVNVSLSPESRNELQAMASTLREKLGDVVEKWAEKDLGTSIDLSSAASAKEVEEKFSLFELRGGTTGNMTMIDPLTLAVVGVLVGTVLAGVGYGLQRFNCTKTATAFYFAGAIFLVVSGPSLIGLTLTGSVASVAGVSQGLVAGAQYVLGSASIIAPAAAYISKESKYLFFVPGFPIMLIALCLWLCCGDAFEFIGSLFNWALQGVGNALHGVGQALGAGHPDLSGAVGHTFNPTVASAVVAA
eukprot:TRINITY_DN64085_c0_g1_i1.p1 TRINITY_DN64085_c0_g1~~TRINITY_DN64085_c0_g1_i1.p1  ORF type:complete len:641 (-),score=41.41 TRINITY_DN64085_c0_g1_i1:84-2006(-)